MPRRSQSGMLLQKARQQSGMSQRALAERARTTQSVVARIEGGQTTPGWDTLEALVRAAGFELDVQLVRRATARSHMMRDVSRILLLSPEDRLREVGAVSRFIASARRL